MQLPENIEIGPVRRPEPITEGPVNFSYVVERFYLDVRDGFRINSRGRPYAKTAYTSFQQTHNWIVKYAQAKGETDLFRITDAWIKGFLQFLYAHPISLNTVTGLVNNVHTIINALILDGLVLNKLTLRVWPEYTDQVYNSLADLKILQKAEYSHETTELVRDIFLIQSHTGFRLGTLKRFLKDPKLYLFKEDGRRYIRIRINKTPREVVIPVKKSVYKILKRRKFRFPAVYYENYYNPIIKLMAKEAGFTEKVTYFKTVGGKLVQYIKPKYALMSSHTARRNFATNAFLAGILVEQIMLITGHKTREEFLKYVRADSLANAIAVSELKFFK